MPDVPRRSLFQLHRSTAIVLLLIAGALIWANAFGKTSWVSYDQSSIYAFNRTQYEITEKVADQLMRGDRRWYYYLVDPIFRVRRYGWPLSVYDWQLRLKPKDFPNDTADPEPVISWSVVGLLLDGALAIVLLTAIWLVGEWLIRRKHRIRRRRKSSTPG